MFIEMPFFSIQGLLSSPPVVVTSSAPEVQVGMHDSQEALQRYGLLSSLFADVDEEEFETKNFGFLTPQEALDEYVDSYDARFTGYLGRALGRFLSLVPRSEYR